MQIIKLHFLVFNEFVGVLISDVEKPSNKRQGLKRQTERHSLCDVFLDVKLVLEGWMDLEQAIVRMVTRGRFQ